MFNRKVSGVYTNFKVDAKTHALSLKQNLGLDKARQVAHSCYMGTNPSTWNTLSTKFFNINDAKKVHYFWMQVRAILEKQVK